MEVAGGEEAAVEVGGRDADPAEGPHVGARLAAHLHRDGARRGRHRQRQLLVPARAAAAVGV